jgi:hypothetical protein
MRYMLTIYGDPSGMSDISPEEQQAELGRWFTYTEELQKAGAMVAGDALQEAGTSTTLRFNGGGEPTTTDGPFAETKEQLGGFYEIDVANLDEALEWAKKIPARNGAVEVRPVQDFSQEG